MTMRVNLHGVIGEITSLPGCSQVAVSHSVFIPIKNRGKGLGTLANNARQELMKDLGYDMALCTVDNANKSQLRVLEKTGWTRLISFVSSKTGNTVAIYCKELIK